MSHFTEYLRSLIAKRMENPDERRARNEERLRGLKKGADATKRGLQYPTKDWGFWRSERMNAQYETNSDPAVKKMLGRSIPTV